MDEIVKELEEELLRLTEENRKLAAFRDAILKAAGYEPKPISEVL